MRILIADDHEVVTRGVISILSKRKDVEVVNDAPNGKRAVEKAREAKPDLIILDITMPVLDGFGAARQIRRFLPKVPILFLSMHHGRHVEEQVKSVGAQGFVKKDEAGIVLLKAVDSLLRNETFFRT
jgi:two-component system nitrate/nitrite response regulator NarL